MFRVSVFIVCSIHFCSSTLSLRRTISSFTLCNVRVYLLFCLFWISKLCRFQTIMNLRSINVSSIYVHLSIYLSAYLSIRPRPYSNLSIFPFTYVPICLTIHLSIYLFTLPCIHSAIYQSNYLLRSHILIYQRSVRRYSGGERGGQPEKVQICPA